MNYVVYIIITMDKKCFLNIYKFCTVVQNKSLDIEYIPRINISLHYFINNISNINLDSISNIVDFNLVNFDIFNVVKNLNYLSLKNNNLNILPKLKSKKLNKLILSNNNISIYISSHLIDCPNLKYLDLQYNNLNKFNDGKYYKHINLSHNKLTFVYIIADYIYLSHNCIEKIDEMVKSYHFKYKTKNINLSFNKISYNYIINNYIDNNIDDIIKTNLLKKIIIN